MPQTRKPAGKPSGKRPAQKRTAPRSRPSSQQQAVPASRGTPQPRPPQEYPPNRHPPGRRPPKKRRKKSRQHPAAQHPPEWTPRSGQNVSRPIDRNARRPQQHSQDQRAAAIGEVQRRRRRRHKRNYTLYYIILFFFLSATGIVLSLTVFFNIETITVQGSEVYAASDVLPLLGVETGDNLLRINTGAMEDALLESLPQADRVTIDRNFPSGLTVTIADGEPSAQLFYDGSYYVVSQSGRILQKNTEARSGSGVVVVGVTLENAQVGDYVDKLQQKNWEEASALAKEQGEDPPEMPDELTSLKTLFSALEAAEFSEVNAVDISSEVSLTIYWQNRIEIRLGSFSELEYKLRFVKEVLTGEEYSAIIPPGEAGILDAQSASSVMPFQPAAGIEVPGGGAGEWNWDDGLADGTAPEDASSLPEDASSTPEDSSAPSEPSSDSSAALPDGDSGGESQVSVSDST